MDSGGGVEEWTLWTYQTGNKRDTVTPNVVFEWLSLLLRIREVPNPNLDPETGYPD
jgi:hypothetical protein